MLMLFRQAKGFRHPRRGAVVWVVLHTTESDIGPAGPGDQGAESTANYFAGNSSTSSHYVTDDDSAVACVAEDAEAYTQAPWNRWAISIEQDARARFTREEWTTVHAGLLEQTAKVVADVCARYELPIRFVNAQQIATAAAAGADLPKGVTTHVELNRAARILGLAWGKRLGLVGSDYSELDWFSLTSHTDPGDGYPADLVLARATAIANPDPDVEPTPVVIPSMEGDEVYVVHEPYVIDPEGDKQLPDGTRVRFTYAKFAGTMYATESDPPQQVAGPVVWIDGPTDAAYRNMLVHRRPLPVTDLHGVVLLGPFPTKNADGSPMDPVHPWERGDFMRVIGA